MLTTLQRADRTSCSGAVPCPGILVSDPISLPCDKQRLAAMRVDIAPGHRLAAPLALAFPNLRAVRSVCTVAERPVAHNYRDFRSARDTAGDGRLVAAEVITTAPRAAVSGDAARRQRVRS